MTITDDAVDLDVTPLSATIGASIRGVDLHGPVSDAVIAQLRACLLRYGVIFLPGQHLGPAEHIDFARRFGQPTPAHPVIPNRQARVSRRSSRRSTRSSARIRRRGARACS